MSEQISIFDYSVENTSESNKKYSEDCGENLPGAKKHLWNMEKFSTEWRETIEKDPVIAFKLVCKDELMEGFSPSELNKKGFSSEAAYAIKLILGRVAKHPEDNSKQRKYYLNAIKELSLRLKDAYNEEEIVEVVYELKDEMRKAHYSRFAHLLEKNPELKEYQYWFSLGERFSSLFLGTTKNSRPGYISLFRKAFSSSEAKDWRWTKPKPKKAIAQKKNVDPWKRVVPTTVIRQSDVDSHVYRPIDLIDHYKFRGIQFGNWVDNETGRYHVISCAEALADLATILGLTKPATSLYGLIGIAFGARGSGKNSAHYEPDTNVINITKYRGGGSLSHEWAHAIDFNLYSFSCNFKNGKKVPLSGSKSGGYLPREVILTFNELMKIIKEGDGFIQTLVPNPLPNDEQSWKPGVKNILEKHNYNINNALMALKKSNYKISKKQWHEIGIFYCNIIANKGLPVPTDFFIPTDYSNFYLDAQGRGQYWQRNHELFARAFESWIEDELHQHNMKNSYLVTGTNLGNGHPYPREEERKAINQAFRDWWQTLNNSGILLDSQLWQC